jgi:hypothetical protein
MQRNLRKFSSAKGNGYELAMSMPVSGALDEIWGALVKREKLQHWLGGVTGQLSKGGKFHLGEQATGQITVCEPKRRLAMIWQQGQVQTGLDITLARVGKAKQSQITLKVAAKMQDLPENAWQRFGPSALGIGWEWVMTRFAAYLLDPKAHPINIAEFAKTPDAQSFVTQAFEGWRRTVDPQIMTGPVPPLLVFYNGLA